MSEDMVQAVMDEFCRDNPGRTVEAMSAKEFADRMMAKVKASAQIVEGGNA